jgi:tRNA U38,U39,U40 pseudouridine synthase TruA
MLLPRIQEINTITHTTIKNSAVKVRNAHCSTARYFNSFPSKFYCKRKIYRYKKKRADVFNTAFKNIVFKATTVKLKLQNETCQHFKFRVI